MLKFAIYNNKGGVGKTTSVINIAYALHKLGNQVLVIDCDMQKNSYMFFLSDIADRILPSKYENIKHTTYNVFTQLSEDELKDFEYIIFDLPPVLSDDVLEIIKKADKVFVPLMLRQFELAGLNNLVSKCNNLGGIFVTMYDNEDEELLKQFKDGLKDRLMDSCIHFSKAVIKSQRAMLPVGEYLLQKGTPKVFRKSWQAYDEYYALTNEIIGRTK